MNECAYPRCLIHPLPRKPRGPGKRRSACPHMGSLGWLPQAGAHTCTGSTAQHLVDSQAESRISELRGQSGKGRELPKAQSKLSLTLEAVGNPGRVAESGNRYEVAVVGMFIPRAAVVGVSNPCQFLALTAWPSFPGPGVDTVDPD